MNRLVLGVAIAALLAVGGCAEDPTPVADPAAQPAQSQSSAASSPSAADVALKDDLIAASVCNGMHFAGNKMRDPERVITLAEGAAASENAALAAAGKRLVEQAAAAQAAKGTADEQRTVDAMVATVREVLAMCAEAGITPT